MINKRMLKAAVAICQGSEFAGVTLHPKMEEREKVKALCEELNFIYDKNDPKGWRFNTTYETFGVVVFDPRP
jgi:hypothetical protein